MMTPKPQRGFTLLIAVILAGVALALGLALLDIAYKQVILAASARQSQVAFYNADSALECALYWDQQEDFFGTNPRAISPEEVSCNGLEISDFEQSGTAPKISTFTLLCPEGGEQAQVTVYKNSPSTPTNRIYANGYNTCDTDNSRRFERGLKVVY